MKRSRLSKTLISGLGALFVIATMVTTIPGCGPTSNEAVAPEKFAPPPPSDTPTGGTKAAPAPAAETVQG